MRKLALPRIERPNVDLSRVEDVVRWVTTFALVAVVGVTLIGNNAHARGADAVFARNMVDRLEAFGGTFYENGIHNKGPLEPFAYQVSRWIAGYDGVWFAISVMIAIAAAVLAFTAFRTALSSGASRAAGFTVAIGVYIHFTLSGADYAGILYSRNMTTGLLALAWLAVVDHRVWATPRRQTVVTVSVGAILGLAVQTLQVVAISAVVVGAAVVVAAAPRVAGTHRRRRLLVLGTAVTVATFSSAPIWYLLRGRFDEFWAGWWTYARFQNTGIGLSLARQFALGWDSFFAYYQARPLAFLVIAAFVVVTCASWAKLDVRTRLVHVALLGWFVAGWLELILSQRYTSHYFSVTSVPTAFMVAALAGYVYRERVAVHGTFRSAYAWPLVMIVISLFLSGGNRLVEAAEHTSRFTSVAHARDDARDAQPGPEKSVQAILDLVSRDRDALLAWSDDPTVYTRYRRVPATRFQQRYFVVGQIYAGERNDKFILPDTVQWFDEDIAESDPKAFVETQEVDDEHVSDLITNAYRPVFANGAGTLHLADGVADELRTGSGTSRWAPPDVGPGDGWTVAGDDAIYASDVAPLPDNRVTVATGACRRVEGRVETDAGDPGIEFHIAGETPGVDAIRIVLDDGKVAVKDPNGGVFDEQPVDFPDRSVPFALVVGTSSAALLVGDDIVAAARIPELPIVSFESLRPALEVTDLRVGPAPAGGGC